MARVYDAGKRMGMAGGGSCPGRHENAHSACLAAFILLRKSTMLSSYSLFGFKPGLTIHNENAVLFIVSHLKGMNCYL
jgi:hypothetical protein